MNLRLITDDASLKAFLPNAFKTADGEPSFFDKLANSLNSAELWFIRYLSGEDTFNFISENKGSLNDLAKQIVASQALINAIPSLDLVLTPNGFGIVSNSNIAPASKERIQNLIKSISYNRDSAIIELLNQLRSVSVWQNSPQHDYYAMTLFPNINVVAQLGCHNNMWEKYQETLPQIINAEAFLENNYFSKNLMKRFRSDVISDEQIPKKSAVVIAVITSQIIHFLRQGSYDVRALVSIVDFIRKNPADFPEWQESDTAKLFKPNDIFKNKKNNHGYFF